MRKTAWLSLMTSLIISPAFAQNSSLDDLLDRAGRNVNQFLVQFSSVTCKEEVLQEKFGPKGKTEERVHSKFDYLVLDQSQGTEPLLYESREALQADHAKKGVSLLLSNGFATQLLVFHPYYQSSFTFERLPDRTEEGKTYIQVRFQYVKGRPTPAALLLRGREYPLPLSGVALLDPRTAMIARITTELGSSMEDLGLKSFHSEVAYAAVSFSQDSKTVWLPDQAVVEVHTPRQHWRNVHRFVNYHLFSVNTTQDVGKVKEQD
jgi:hypothetical protein